MSTRNKPRPKTGLSTEIRVDLDTASREELAAEVERLAGVCEEWARNWHVIVHANAEAWQDMVADRDQKIAALEEVLGVRLVRPGDG